ncbi:MAG TPA: FIST N-terminal domain-containing protein [Labilithrix sp.]|nr:FIST N-terminal domain-containing protein [Labilithrix sp.]
MQARAWMTRTVNSEEAGREVGRVIAESFAAAPPAVVLCHAAVSHDQAAFLRGLRESVGPVPAIVGGSVQGMVTTTDMVDSMHCAGAVGLGGERLGLATAFVEEIQDLTAEKGRELGRRLVAGAAGPPKVVVLGYDPLCGADLDVFLEALAAEVRCPIVGAGSGHIVGPMVRTYQYDGDRVVSHGAFGIAISGALTCETAICDGTVPVGVEMTVTAADGNRLLELDGRPALDIWEEITSGGPPHIDHTAALALALPTENGPTLVRAAFGIDAERRGIVLQAGIQVGTKVMLHHRAVEPLLEATAVMAAELAARLRGRRAFAALGFECGARTRQFLGRDATLAENRRLQQAVAPDAEWFGCFAWGELYTHDRPVFVNYSFPLLLLIDG